MTANFSALQQRHSICLRAKFSLDRFILPSSSGEQKKTIFWQFCALRHLVALPLGGDLRKLNTGAQL